MFERLKQSVQSVLASYVGALGWLLAQSLLHFANIFTAPVAGLSCREYRGFTELTTLLPGFSLQDAVTELIRS